MPLPTGDLGSRGNQDVINRHSEDFQELEQAAVERLSGLDSLRRRRTAYLPAAGKDQDVEKGLREIDLYKAGRETRKELVARALNTQDQDQEQMLRKVRERMDRVGIELASVEVRYENLNVESSVYVGSRALPTVLNSYRNVLDKYLQMLRLVKSNKRKFVMLDNVSGILPPGRMTLLLGPPGAGKSTLLQALSGKLIGSDLKIDGNITYNGKHFNEFVPRRTAAYVDQTDIHLGELTVRETFDFSSRCQGVGHKAEELEELLKREKEQGIKDVDPWLDAFMKAEVRKGKRETVVSDYIIKILGLDVCADTIVGNDMIRGISGGQKKRVTTGEMIVGPCKTLYLDEISTGLDSSSTFQIVKCMRDFVHHRQATLLMALLQPAPECYDLFDDILLLSEGLVVYHGPRDEVLPFFESCGFKIPGRKAVPDFLQEVTSKKDQQQYWFKTKNPYKFVPVMAFADAFKKYKTGQRNAEALSVPYPAESGHKQALVYDKFALSSWQSFKALLRREYMLVERNSFVYIFKATQAGIVAFIVGTVFLRTQLHPNSQNQAQSYAAMLFFSLLQMFFNGIAEMTFTIDRLPVFYKQRDALFFPTWAYVVPTNLGRIPVSFLETTIWVALTYWEVGLAPNAGRFFMYYFIIFLIHNMAISLFRAIGSLARNIVVANALGSMALFCVILMGGFVLVKDNIHPWTVWVFWINPMQYAQRAILINEFSDPRWQNLLVPGSTESVGDNQLATYGFVSHYWWVWLGVGVLIFANLLFLTITILAHQFLDSFEGSNTTVSEDMLNERAIASKGHTDPNAGPEVTIDVKDKERASQRTSQRRMALQDYASKHMSSRATGGGSQGSIDPASRRSMNVSQGSLELQRPGGSKKVMGGEAEGLKSYPEEGSQPSTNGTGPNGSAAPGYPQTEGPTSGKSSNFAEGRSGDGADGAADDGETQRGMVLPFEPLTMSFDDMHYFVDVPAALAGKSLPTIKKVDGKDQLELLQGITSAFRPGILTCLMGVSGAGKTTLMDVLAGRKTGGIIQGDIRINGHPKKQETFARVSGYVEQFDVHSPQTTIREALLFSGRLRFSKGVERSTIDAFVDEVMDLVELGSLRDSVVGVPGVSGLSVEQRKRLTIAVELVANPSIVFMDEPTSGLDARAAAIVMRTVRNIVNTGRTIVCTIHQPSIDIFESFDELLLLKRGGETIYAGPLGHDSADLIDYYEAVQGVPRIREGLNPATWMLEVTTPGQEDRLQVEFAEVYRNSQLAKDRDALVKAEAAPREGVEDLHFDSVYARGFMEQFRIMLWKFNIVYWRLPEYNGVRFSFTMGIGLIFGAVFWRLGGKSGTEQDLYNILGALYTAVLFLGIMNSIFVQPIFSNERAVFYRERAAGMYSVAPWYLGIAVIEISYLLVQTVIYTAITYPMAWFYMSPAKWFWYLWFMFLTLMYFNFYGIACVAVTPNLLVAAVLSGAFYGIFNLFAGFVIARGSLPGWWVWMYYLNPVAWTLYGLVGSNLGDIHWKMVTLQNGGGQQSVPDFLLDRFEYSYGFLGQVSAILIAWCIVLWALGAFAMKKLNFQKR